MDCSINELAIVPTTNVVSICENRPSFYLTTAIRNLLDCSNDQSIPINHLSTKIDEDSDDIEKENHSTEVGKIDYLTNITFAFNTAFVVNTLVYKFISPILAFNISRCIFKKMTVEKRFDH